MRALVIEFLHEVVECRLLLQDIHARRAGGFLLERQMHALMAAVFAAGFPVLCARMPLSERMLLTPFFPVTPTFIGGSFAD